MVPDSFSSPPLKAGVACPVELGDWEGGTENDSGAELSACCISLATQKFPAHSPWARDPALDFFSPCGKTLPLVPLWEDPACSRAPFATAQYPVWTRTHQTRQYHDQRWIRSLPSTQ